MSTVLWANMLDNGEVESDEADKYALYKHAEKLDSLTAQLQVMSFTAVQDFTDAQFNLNDEDLPEGMESTDELMAEKGTWVSGAEAVEMLKALISHISGNEIRFGVLSNDHDDIIRELKESLLIAEKASSRSGKFNYSVVM